VGQKPVGFVPGQNLQTYATSKLVLCGSFGSTSFPLIQFVAPGAGGFLGTPFFQSKVVCLDVTHRIAAIR